MKPIAINGRFLTQPVTGVQRYARELIFTLDAMLASGELQPPEQPVELLVPRTLRECPPLRFIQLRRVGFSDGQLWEQVQLSTFCRGKLLFTPCGGAPLLHRSHVFTIPDAAVFAMPNAYTRAYRTWYRWHHRHAARLAGLTLLTVSEFSRRELARHLYLDPSRITVIPLGHEHVFRAPPQPEILARLDLPPRRYILAVGSANPNKNLCGLMKAFRFLRQQIPNEKQIRLVIAGSTDSRVFGREIAGQENVLQTGFICDGELRALYENAACFVFPSLYEGFGLPLLEAMALGCPAVVSNAASLPELGADAAIFFDPKSPEQMASAIAPVLTDETLRDGLTERGKDRAGKFRWKQTARKTWATLLEAAGR